MKTKFYITHELNVRNAKTYINEDGGNKIAQINQWLGRRIRRGRLEKNVPIGD